MRLHGNELWEKVFCVFPSRSFSDATVYATCDKGVTCTDRMMMMVNPTITTALVMDMTQVRASRVRVQACTADSPFTTHELDVRPSPRPMLASNRTGRNTLMLLTTTPPSTTLASFPYPIDRSRRPVTNMVSILRVLKNIRQGGIKQWWRNMQCVHGL
jgi:hypothetical protein